MHRLHYSCGHRRFNQYAYEYGHEARNASGVEGDLCPLRLYDIICFVTHNTYYFYLLEKVQNEIENVIGSQVEHRKEMPYTDAVIHEIQRFGDIAPGSLPDATTTDITFKGYNLPKGTTVIPLLPFALSDKDYF
ncbi:unnamed protein product [Ranitomeya imitator]|uniref:Cytochrome P450 n=1 Tax=Ranitomeya imitator TaxID=111125 RepID=A0ABN9M143_9NEOB|nr:unnamed protein product [Ranitomeya imitator]